MTEYRSGLGTAYWYEWEIGVLKCLEMLSDMTIASVTLQASSLQSLDDVVVSYEDGSTENIQVKHTDVDAHFTYSTLTSDGGMLHKWAKEWQENKNSTNIRAVCIVTNKTWGENRSNGKCSFDEFVNEIIPRMKIEYSFAFDGERQEKAANWFRQQLSFLGDDAAGFTKALSFLQAGDIQETEKKIWEKLQTILGTDRDEIIELSQNSLYAQLRIWATSSRKRQEIYREDVYSILCPQVKDLPQYELYPEKPVFPSRIGFAVEFIEKISKSTKNLFFLEGMPGAGKTNFVSYLAQLEETPVDFRFYTYIPVNKKHPSFSDDEGYYSGDLLWRSILTQLKHKFEQMGALYCVQFPLIYGYMSVTEMRETALKFLPIYAEKVGHPCYIFIDGLDHAARSKDSRNSFLHQLPMTNEIGDNVKIILVGQPINEKYPTWLRASNDIEHIRIPSLEQEDIIMLLKTENMEASGIDINSLAESIIEVVGNNALNVLFAIQEIKVMKGAITFDSVIEHLNSRQLNGYIGRYYEWIVNSGEDNLLIQKLEFIFAFCSRKLSLELIAGLCGESKEYVAYYLSKLFPLISKDDDGYYTFHNDVRLYFKQMVLSCGIYEVMAIAFRDKVLSNGDLESCQYDIVFNSLLELQNAQPVLSVFTPEYLIKSTQYGVSINKLVRQFSAIANKLIESGELELLNRLSIAATTINQYISCAEYNNKERVCYENEVIESKTKAEKYILDARKELERIVSDIHLLVVNGEKERGKRVFEEYLTGIGLNVVLSCQVEGKEDYSEKSFYEKAGYIYRYYYPEILEQSQNEDEKAYLGFVRGWLEAASNPEFGLVLEIGKTFCFEKYVPIDLSGYVKRLCDERTLTEEAFKKLSGLLLSGSPKPINCLIELCLHALLEGFNGAKLAEVIWKRFEEIQTDPTVGYPWERITQLIKAYFCVYSFADNENRIKENYIQAMQQTHITEGSRGYLPALMQFEIAKNVFHDFFARECNNNVQLDAIYTLVYLSNKFGPGSCHDCDAFATRKFLMKVICRSYIREYDLSKIASICKKLEYLYMGKEPRCVKELLPLFEIDNCKTQVERMAKHWIGENGIAWNMSYSEVEFVCESFIPLLEKFDLEEFKRIVEKRMKFKLLGYTGHKDYSLNDLLELYRLLPLSQEKLEVQGMQLLTVSDIASSIGDNRISHEINKEVFRTAIDLGPCFVDALFELKNTPEDFCYWRECFLDVYRECIERLDLDNHEIFSLYQILNAWVSVEIETSKKRGYNRLDYLKRYNSYLASRITDAEIKDAIEKSIDIKAWDEVEIAQYTPKSVNPEIVSLVREYGYSQDVGRRIRESFSDDRHEYVELLLGVGEYVTEDKMKEYVGACVIPYIVQLEFGFRSDGSERLLKQYGSHFTRENWTQIVSWAISKIPVADMRFFSGVSDDLEIVNRCFYENNSPEELSRIFSEKIQMHMLLITACYLLRKEAYVLKYDARICNLIDFRKKHLGK